MNGHQPQVEEREPDPDTSHRTGKLRSFTALEEEQLTRGQRLADAVTRTMGSWRFIIVQTILLIMWVTLNVVGYISSWDPYPFILLNLALSFQAAYAAPIIMMSQNRQTAKDRLNAEHDFQIDTRAEHEVASIQARLNDLAGNQWDALVALQHQQLEMLNRIEKLTHDVHQIMGSRDDG